MGQLAALIQQLAEIREGAGTALDSTLIWATSENGPPMAASSGDLPPTAGASSRIQPLPSRCLPSSSCRFVEHTKKRALIALWVFRVSMRLGEDHGRLTSAFSRRPAAAADAAR